jgi:hypothetical protein
MRGCGLPGSVVHAPGCLEQASMGFYSRFVYRNGAVAHAIITLDAMECCQ